MVQKPYDPARGERRIVPRSNSYDVSIRIHLSEDARHITTITAKNRGITVQEALNEALNDWLEKHGQPRLV